MNANDILTEDLTLAVNTAEQLRAQIDAMSPENRAQVSPAWLASAMAAAAPDPWIHGFTIVHRASGAIIGNCGFKGPPTHDGRVEIAYGIDEAHRGRGYATQAAKALTAFALSSPGVKIVIAHTLREESASTTVLKRSGFVFFGEVVDPEDGPVWRWEFAAPR